MNRPAFIVGLVLNAINGLSNIPTLIVPTAGPAPVMINVLDGVLGIALLAGVVLAWRPRHRVLGVVIMIVGEVLLAVTTLPAFFADVSSAVKVIGVVGLVLELLAIALVVPALRAQRTAGAQLSR